MANNQQRFSMMYYLGVDIGTTSTKAVAFSDTGEMVAIHSSFYSMHHPHEGWSEQDPEEIARAVVTAVNTVLKQLSPHPPRFVSFSGAMHSLIAVDAAGEPLTPCIIWADNRATDVATALRHSEQGMAFYRATGVPVHPMSPLCKILWLRREEPELFRKAARFIGIKEYVVHRLFGEYVVDSSIASATGLLNLDSLQWDDEVLEFLGITADRLSAVVPPEYVVALKKSAPGWLVPPGTPIVIGASDGALANLGVGALNRHTLAVTIGTSSALRIVTSAPRTDRSMRTFCYHLAGGEYVAGGASNNGAVVLQWLKDNILQTAESYEVLLAEAEAVPAGSEGLVFAPYILGERAPIWDARARGVLMGLDIRHTRAHMVRAALEGVVFCLYSIARALPEWEEVTELRASGGFAQNSLPLQVLADVFYRKVTVSSCVESSARGAVILGAKALGIEPHFSDEMAALYYPNPANRDVYSERVKGFKGAYALWKELF
jgi:gluconokinase